MPERVNNFAIKIATVNGTGSASANSLLMKSIFRSGVPVMGKNYFPSNIQGLPTWYEIRVTKDSYVARSGKIDLMVAHERRDVHQGRARSGLRRLSDLRLHLAASRLAGARRHHRARRAAGEALQRKLQRRAHAHPDEEHLLRRRARGAARSGHREDPRIAGGNLRQEAGARGLEHEGHRARLQLHARELQVPAAHARGAGPARAARKPRATSSSTATPRRGSGCVFAGATVGAWYPITPSTSLMDAYKMFADKLRVDPAPARRTSRSSRPKTSSRPSAWCWAPTGMARARSPPPPVRACR